MGRAKTAIARVGQEESLEHVLQHRGQNPSQTLCLFGILGGSGSPSQQAARPHQQCQAQGTSGMGVTAAGPFQMTARQSRGCLAVYCTTDPCEAQQKVLLVSFRVDNLQTDSQTALLMGMRETLQKLARFF